MKTHSGAAKRYKVTGSGKVIRRKINRGHLLTKKSAKRKRRLSLTTEVSAQQVDRIERALGIRINSSARQKAAREKAAREKAAKKTEK
jgi:large subunit ribosomal protein L35